MEMTRLGVAAAIALTCLSASAVLHAQTLVKVDGSSTVYPITEAVAEDFQKSKKNSIRVTVGISGTGGDFRKFCRGETDISTASRPITKKEMEDCKVAGVEFMEFPVAYDALTVVINPKNDWARKMTVAELKAIWEPAAQGKITNWRQVNPAWPDRPLKLYGPGADSGTFEYFTEAINGKSKATRGDFTASEDDNVLVQGVARDIGGLGYFGFAYFVENKSKLAAVSIATEAGKPAVGPSLDTVINGTYQPLARPIFVYVNAKAADRPDVREFVEYYMKHGESLAKEVKYVPLPAKAYAYNLEHFAKRAKGTKFGGENKVGITIEELMKIEAK